MRGGLDDALEKLARRDELRRRAAGQAAGTAPAVTELVEAVAAVVARNPELAITMGVEGAGDPVLLTFALDDGIVQVSADNPLTAQTADETSGGPRHADFDLDLEPVDEPNRFEPNKFEPSRPFEPGPFEPSPFEPGPFEPNPPRGTDHDAATGRHGSPYQDDSRHGGRFAEEPAEPMPSGHGGDGQETTDLGSDDTLSYAKKFGRPEAVSDTPPAYEQPTAFARPDVRAEPVPSPYAASPPPPVPPQTRGSRSHDDEPPPRQTPTPMPTPMPLRVEPEVTELAAKRLAALLREDPSLLHPHPHD